MQQIYCENYEEYLDKISFYSAIDKLVLYTYYEGKNEFGIEENEYIILIK